MDTTKKAPWKKKNPKKRSTPLSPAQKAWAKESAERAGRRYPNLIDNMLAARQPRTKLPSKKAGKKTKKRSKRKTIPKNETAEPCE